MNLCSYMFASIYFINTSSSWWDLVLFVRHILLFMRIIVTAPIKRFKLIMCVDVFHTWHCLINVTWKLNDITFPFILNAVIVNMLWEQIIRHPFQWFIIQRWHLYSHGHYRKPYYKLQNDYHFPYIHSPCSNFKHMVFVTNSQYVKGGDE